jgi:lipoprotein-releasing system ATP-binding protein
MSSKTVLRLSGIGRAYQQGRSRLEVLNGVDLELAEGEIVALVGPSGAGKSTLLHVAGLLEPPDSGSVFICGQTCDALGDDGRTDLRRNHIGFVYQFHHLLPEFSALENIVIPQIIAGMGRKEAGARANQLLGWLGLSERAKHRPGRLSGGEQQRVAIARALANAPQLLLADEPTGNLDPSTAADVFSVLVKLARGAGLAALIATHNHDLAASLDRTVRLENGVLVGD